MGGALYIATFVLNTNYNYRLIMLLLTVPALLQLSASAVTTAYRRLAFVQLGSLAVGWWLSSQTSLGYFFVKEAAN